MKTNIPGRRFSLDYVWPRRVNVWKTSGSLDSDIPSVTRYATGRSCEENLLQAVLSEVHRGSYFRRATKTTSGSLMVIHTDPPSCAKRIRTAGAPQGQNRRLPRWASGRPIMPVRVH